MSGGEMKISKLLPLACILAVAASPGYAQVKIGVTVSATGPQASLGVPEVNAIGLLAKEIGGQKVEYTILDDKSDTTQVVANTRKLIAENVDVIIGSSTTPNTLAMIGPVAEGQTPVISLASSARLISPMDDQKRWIFKTPHSDSHMASAIADHASKTGVKKIAFIGFNNALGDAFSDEITRYAGQKNIQVVANERYAPQDTSVLGQVLKLLAANPDAVVIGASGTPAALPAIALAQRNYTGKIYFNHGVSNNDFVRICGKNCDNAYVPTGPVMVAEQLPDSNPVKKNALAFLKQYESKFDAGSVSIFAAYSADTGLILEQAIPAALKKAKPGSVEFRQALRDAIESVHGLATTTGIVNMSPQDHVGLGFDAPVMAQIVNSKWQLAK
jgi:branched-chain amino acid transport system substrate-binding protein